MFHINGIHKHVETDFYMDIGTPEYEFSFYKSIYFPSKGRNSQQYNCGLDFCSKSQSDLFSLLFTEGDEVGTGITDDNEDENSANQIAGKIPNFCVLLHGSLKVEGMVAIVQLG